MHVDVKNTVWFRYKLPDNITKEQVEKLKQAIVESEGEVDFKNAIEDIGIELDEYVGEYLYDTSEEVTVKNNRGSSTVEMYEDGEVLSYNGEG